MSLAKVHTEIIDALHITSNLNRINYNLERLTKAIENHTHNINNSNV